MSAADARPPDTGPPPRAGVPDAGGPAAGASDAQGKLDDGRTFEDLVGELEEVTERLSGGQIGIEAAADLYERAERLHALARARLEAIQERVDRMAGDHGGFRDLG